MGRRVGIDNPYPEAKAALIGGVAVANGCRAVWSKEFGFVTVFGHPEDVEGVEELFTSLLIQATAALQREGSRQDRHGRSRTTRFRRSFLIGFAHRIAQRLQETSDETVKKAEAETGADLVPLLDARATAAEEAMEAAFTGLRGMRTSVSDREGYWAGTDAADRADLSMGPRQQLHG